MSEERKDEEPKEEEQPLTAADDDEPAAAAPAAAAPDDDGPTQPAADAGEEAKGERQEEWVVMQSRTQGRPYYYHTSTKETVWEKPEGYTEDALEGEDGWIEMESRSQGRYYYYNQQTKECVWDRPKGVPEPPPFERRRPNPKRDALRHIINDWADEFQREHGREPTEEDIPQGSDIARHHRDYRMLKQEEEVEKLKKEQTQLRQELSPDSRERLIRIKEDLSGIEEKVAEWKRTKEEERARREKVTTTYNAWIKEFTEENGRGPTEKDIAPYSDIAGMFAEYTRYREEARRAKARAARIEETQRRTKHEEDNRKIKQFMHDFEKTHQRWPTQKDLPKGSDIERMYKNYLERELELNPDSPRSKREFLRRQINAWSSAFERAQGRKPTRRDIQPGSDIEALYSQYDSLGDKRAPKPADSRGSRYRAPQKSRHTGDTYGDEELQALHGGSSSPRSYSQYQRNRPSNGCCDCCAMQ
eukprot:TRINITY_DN2006_c2_g1_i2.p1 TRINITY_DN2006_c2_g1~~TRINITY_DN2006_c2_g1_i2.p1  ORF type:complete len:474 (+),score=190.37 TRINITY_DN2006_c2_g1_i2:779-2200(+)